MFSVKIIAFSSVTNVLPDEQDLREGMITTSVLINSWLMHQFIPLKITCQRVLFLEFDV